MPRFPLIVLAIALTATAVSSRTASAQAAPPFLNATADSWGVPCPVTTFSQPNGQVAGGESACTGYPHPVVISTARASALAVRGRLSGTTQSTVWDPYSSDFTASAYSAQTWMDVLSWTAPTVSQVVFTLSLNGGLWGSSRNFRRGSRSSTGTEATLAFWDPANPAALVSTFGRVETEGYSTFLALNRTLSLALPVTGQTSAAFAYSLSLASGAYGHASGTARAHALLQQLTFLDDTGSPLSGVTYSMAYGTTVGTVTPEPLTVSLLGGGLAALAALKRRRRPHG